MAMENAWAPGQPLFPRLRSPLTGLFSFASSAGRGGQHERGGSENDEHEGHDHSGHDHGGEHDDHAGQDHDFREASRRSLIIALV